MGIKRIVDVGFWTDGKVDEFSPEDKYFMLYLLTNPFSKQLGIYEISIKQAAFQLGYSQETVLVLLDRFETKYNMIRFSKQTSEVAIINFLRHSIMKGGKPVEDCIKQDMAKVKDKTLIDFVFRSLKSRSDWDDMNATVKKIVTSYFHNENDNHNQNDNDNDNDNDRTGDESCHDSSAPCSDDDIETIIFYLNSKAYTNYKATTESTKELIAARFAEGFTAEDFRTVIDKKCAEWLGTEYEQYLCPKTLFDPEKFERYLNAKIIQRNSVRQEPIPEWMKLGYSSLGEYARDKFRRDVERKTAGNTPEIAERAEELKQRISCGAAG